jgi:5-methylcytosine-specific restriction endonuclease McrA
MSEVLHKSMVLVLNRNWQAIDVKTPAQAFCMMAGDVATALDIDGDLRATRWTDWLQLVVRTGDHSVRTVRGEIRVPTVIVLARFARVPKRRPKLSARTIWHRDRATCQYTGRLLRPGEGNIDHIVPRSRGGQSTWENCVLADRRINSRKADRLPEEVGLKLRRAPIAPREVPVTSLIQNSHQIADWRLFLK